MRIVLVVACLAAGCGTTHAPPPAEPVEFPLPPLSRTVVGALINAADELALDDAQLRALQELDGPLRERHDLVESELEQLRRGTDARHPGGDGAPRRGRGGGKGGPGGGMGGPGGGGPPGGMSPSGDAPPRMNRPPPDPDAMRAARARADQLDEQRLREQHDAAERALALLRPDQLDAARAIVADYFRPSPLGPPGDRERPPSSEGRASPAAP